MQVHTQNSEQWQVVMDVFQQNQREGDDGSSLALMVDGELVLHITAGVGQNRSLEKKEINWTDNTLVNVFSAGKGLVAICVLQLIQAGMLKLKAPIQEYWPQFGKHNKDQITLEHILTHRSGLSAFHQFIAPEDIFDWPRMIETIENETCWWQPGEVQGYSPFIFGWVLGELVKRVSGKSSFNDYFQEAVARPLGIECHFGVPEQKFSQIVDTLPLKKLSEIGSLDSDADNAALGKIMKADPRGITNRAFSNPFSLLTSVNSPAWRQAEIPAANAHTNAIGLAAIYGDLALANSRLLDAELREKCWQEKTFEMDKVLGLPLRFSCGFLLSQPQRKDCQYGRGGNAFGHPGAGGSLGFCDPKYGVGFGYVTQRMGQNILIDARASRLIDSIYSILER